MFDQRADTRLSAGLNMARTIFVCIVLVLAALMFNNDTNNLVLVPIERMMAGSLLLPKILSKLFRKKKMKLIFLSLKKKLETKGFVDVKKIKKNRNRLNMRLLCWRIL